MTNPVTQFLFGVIHCFSLKMSPKVWVNSNKHCTCRAERQTTNLFSRFQSEHSCGAKSCLSSAPTQVGQH